MTHESNGYDVYYAAPAFYVTDDFDRYYDLQALVENSAFFSPSEIGAVTDDDHHYVAFMPSSNRAYICSEMSKISPPLSGEAAIREFFNREQISNRRSMREQLPTAYQVLYESAVVIRQTPEAKTHPPSVDTDSFMLQSIATPTSRWQPKLPPKELEIERMPSAIAEIARRFFDCQVIFMQVEPEAERE